MNKLNKLIISLLLLMILYSLILNNPINEGHTNNNDPDHEHNDVEQIECEGNWSDCTSRCERGDDRVWVFSGNDNNNSNCNIPEPEDCIIGDGECIKCNDDSDCEPSFTKDGRCVNQQCVCENGYSGLRCENVDKPSGWSNFLWDRTHIRSKKEINEMVNNYNRMGNVSHSIDNSMRNEMCDENESLDQACINCLRRSMGSAFSGIINDGDSLEDRRIAVEAQREFKNSCFSYPYGYCYPRWKCSSQEKINALTTIAKFAILTEKGKYNQEYINHDKCPANHALTQAWLTLRDNYDFEIEDLDNWQYYKYDIYDNEDFDEEMRDIYSSLYYEGLHLANIHFDVYNEIPTRFARADRRDGGCQITNVRTTR